MDSLNLSLLASFKGVVFTCEDDVRYVYEIMTPELRETYRSLDDVKISKFEVADGEVHLVLYSRKEKITSTRWLTMLELIDLATSEDWHQKNPPDDVYSTCGMWDGHGDWMEFHNEEEELPPEI